MCFAEVPQLESMRSVLHNPNSPFWEKSKTATGGEKSHRGLGTRRESCKKQQPVEIRRFGAKEPRHPETISDQKVLLILTSLSYSTRSLRCASPFFFFFPHTFYFPASGQAVVTGVVPPPPRFLPSIFIAHRVQQSHCSPILHRVLLTHALALSASQFVHKKKSQRIYSNGHSASQSRPIPGWRII